MLPTPELATRRARAVRSTHSRAIANLRFKASVGVNDIESTINELNLRLLSFSSHTKNRRCRDTRCGIKDGRLCPLIPPPFSPAASRRGRRERQTLFILTGNFQLRTGAEPLCRLSRGMNGLSVLRGPHVFAVAPHRAKNRLGGLLTVACSSWPMRDAVPLAVLSASDISQSVATALDETICPTPIELAPMI